MSKKPQGQKPPTKEWDIEATWEVTHQYKFAVHAATEDEARDEALRHIEEDIEDPLTVEPNDEVQINKCRLIVPKVSTITITLDREVTDVAAFDRFHAQMSALTKKLLNSATLDSKESTVDKEDA